jgi:hypothetical protein
MNSSPRFFAVTTPGLSATRWLSYVLAAHPDVYVAHGKHRLDAVVRGDFERSKGSADLDSLVHGNDLFDFYVRASLEEVLLRYQETRPGARALGCVHTYTIESLVRAARRPEVLARLQVRNVVRHPVSYIASHYSLVRSAESHPALYRLYLEQVFPQALEAFPELFLLECPDFRAFLAFAVSCYGVADRIHDACYPGLRHVKMEDLTTSVEILQDSCESLTGLCYSPEMLAEFLQGGAVNRHRSADAIKDPQAVFAGWEPWQQDMAVVMIPGIVLDWLEGIGYDVSMLRAAASRPTAGQRTSSKAPCLGDCLRSLDPQHPLLAWLGRPASSPIRRIEAEFQGFDLVRYRERDYAVARVLGSADLSGLSPEKLRDLEDKGLCLPANSVPELWTAIWQVVSDVPELLEEQVGFNLIGYRGRVFAVVQSAGALDLQRALPDELRELESSGRLFAAPSVAEARAWVARQSSAPLLVEEGHHGFNLVAFRGKVFALAQNLGAFDLGSATAAELSKCEEKGLLLSAASAQEVRSRIARMPRRESREGLLTRILSAIRR